MSALKRLVKARVKQPPVDDLIRQIQKEALMRQLETPELWAPGELWPNESLEPENPGRFLLAKLRQRDYTA